MARPKPNPDEVVPLIKSEALALIKQHGFANLTMKRLAMACDMSVGKLYHFFAGKDELFLKLEIDYFEEVYLVISEARALATAQGGDSASVLASIIKAYFDHSVSHIDLYQLVTSPPKVYSNYLGTETEGLARQELASAMRAIELFRSQFKLAAEDKGEGAVDSIERSRLFVLLVNSIHGLILMSQSAAWPYLSLDLASAERGQVTPDLDAEVENQIRLIIGRLI